MTAFYCRSRGRSARIAENGSDLDLAVTPRVPLQRSEPLTPFRTQRTTPRAVRPQGTSWHGAEVTDPGPLTCSVNNQNRKPPATMNRRGVCQADAEMAFP